MKKILSFFLCVLLCLSVCPSFALAEVGSDEEDPTLNPVRVAFEGGYLTIQKDGTLIESEGLASGGDMEIPSTLGGITVTAIGPEAHLGHAGGILTLPDTVQKVNVSGFIGAKRVLVSPSNPWFCNDEKGNLYSKDRRILYYYDVEGRKTVTVPEGVEELADNCLYDQEYGMTVILPRSMKRLGDYTLQDDWLKLTVSSNVEEVKYFAFLRDPTDNVATLTADVTALSPKFFEYFGGKIVVEPGNPRYEVQDGIVYDTWEQAAVFCDRNAKSAVIRAGTRSIGDAAFSECHHLRSVSLPEGLLSIGNDAFCDCFDLKTINLPDSIEVVGERAFGDSTLLQNVPLPKNLRRVGNDAFAGVTYSTLVLPEGLEEIGTPDGPDSIVNCAVFTGTFSTVVIPPSVRYIGRSSFHSYGPPLAVILPDQEIDVAYSAFYRDYEYDIRNVIFYGEEGSFAQRYAETEEAIFRVGKPEDYPADYVDPYPGTPFRDIYDCEWPPEVKSAYQKGLMVGVSGDRFAPGAPFSRAMFVTVLHRIAGEPEPVGEATFSDVNPNAYYGKAMAWAEENGVVTGVGNGKMNPHRAITYQEAAAILHRWYAKQKGISDEEFAQQFPEGKRWTESERKAYGVSDWAALAYQRMTEWGVVPRYSLPGLAMGGREYKPGSAVDRYAAAGMFNSYVWALERQPPDEWPEPAIG